MNRLTIEQERDALYNAARRVGLDARITYMERKGDAHTYAEKLMLNSYRKGMPYKSSTATPWIPAFSSTMTATPVCPCPPPGAMGPKTWAGPSGRP